MNLNRKIKCKKSQLLNLSNFTQLKDNFFYFPKKTYAPLHIISHLCLTSKTYDICYIAGEIKHINDLLKYIYIVTQSSLNLSVNLKKYTSSRNRCES